MYQRQLSFLKIDLIVDTLSKHELLSFMDAFFRYHQIKMHPPDIEKTSFIAKRGLYCYKVMPFWLKNAGATYQRLVNKMLKDLIGDTIDKCQNMYIEATQLPLLVVILLFISLFWVIYVLISFMEEISKSKSKLKDLGSKWSALKSSGY